MAQSWALVGHVLWVSLLPHPSAVPEEVNFCLTDLLGAHVLSGEKKNYLTTVWFHNPHSLPKA